MNIKSYILENNIEHSDILLETLKPSISITTNKESLKKTNSKFGGVPYIDKNFKHPIFNESPLTFIGQIFLNDIKKFQHLSFIPSNGMLYFFINTNIINRYPDKENEFKVIFSPVRDNNALTPFINENNKIFNESFLDFFEDYSFPSYQEYEVLQLLEKGIDIDETVDEINELKSESLGYKSDLGHQFFGNPQALQGTVKFHWAKNQLKYEFPIDEEKKLDINQLEKEYELLLQIDFSDKNLNFPELFGDSVAYFGINKDDLLNMNFENVKLTFQST